MSDRDDEPQPLPGEMVSEDANSIQPVHDQETGELVGFLLMGPQATAAMEDPTLPFWGLADGHG